MSRINHKKDFLLVTTIGALIGLLVQPIITNLVVHPSLMLRLGIFFGLLGFAPTALLAAWWLGKLWRPFYQFAKFGAVGTLNFSLDIGTLNFALYLTGITSGALYSFFKALSFLVGTTNSFLWNRKWTFYHGNPLTFKEAGTFYAVALIGGAVNVALASYVVNGISRPEGITPNLWANVGALIGILTGVFFDFFGYKYLVYKEHRRPKT